MDPDARHIGNLALGLGYGDLEAGHEFRYGLDLDVTNLRLVAGKQIAAFQLAGGIGWDRYTGDAEIRLRGDADPAVSVELKQSRTLAFINAGVDLAAVSIVGEAGYQSGRDQELSTDFEDYDTTDGKFFAGLGLRLSF